MSKLTPRDVADLPDDCRLGLVLQDLDTLLTAEVDVLFKDSLRVLKNHGIVEFHVLDFGWVVQEYMTYQDDVLQRLCTALFSSPRTTLWNEFAVVKHLLAAGFYKVWTGHAAELPVETLLVKAIKFVPPN